jgi:hypothetical protein
MAQQERGQSQFGSLQEALNDEGDLGLDRSDEVEAAAEDAFNRELDRRARETPAQDPYTGEFQSMPPEVREYLKSLATEADPQTMARALLSLGMVNPDQLGVNTQAEPSPAETNAGMDDFDQGDQGDDLDQELASMSPEDREAFFQALQAEEGIDEPDLEFDESPNNYEAFGEEFGDGEEEDMEDPRSSRVREGDPGRKQYSRRPSLEDQGYTFADATEILPHEAACLGLDPAYAGMRICYSGDGVIRDARGNIRGRFHTE